MSRFIREITITDKCRISNDSPVFVIAEAACNHMCDMDIAIQMIDAAAESGVDAIKFQTYKAEKLVTKDASAFWGNEKMSQIEYYKRLDRFGKNEYVQLFSHAKKKGIVCFSSPFDDESADMLNDLGMPVFKIASCEITNLDFIRHIAAFGKPIMLSTGASTADEIDKAINVIAEEGNRQLLLMACTLSYPTKNEDANLSRIQTLKNNYPELLVGLSDHTEPDESMIIPSIGVALGARAIEKHYTLDRTMTGSGHFFAVDPRKLKAMVRNIRLTEAVLGDGKLGIADSEIKAWKSARKYIVAEVDIKKGQTVTREMLGLKRTSAGLSADAIDEVVGKKATVDIVCDQKVSLEILK